MDLLIFDLDGTLIDSKRDLAEAVNATRGNLGLAPLDLETISKYVGNGAPVLIRRALGPEYADEQVQEALMYFLEYYREHCLDYTRLYRGVLESLERLRGAGVRMAVLTNKPVRVSKAIVEGLGTAGHFFQVYGGNSFEQKKPHRVGVDALRQEAGGIAPERTMMVGDSCVDVQTAVNAGVRSCGVTFGFQPETLTDPKPDLLVDRMEDLADWVLSANRAARRLRRRRPHVIETKEHSPMFPGEGEEMNHKPGDTAPATGMYWCTVCKLPARFEAGQILPECGNMCGRGLWQLVKPAEERKS